MFPNTPAGDQRHKSVEIPSFFGAAQRSNFQSVIGSLRSGIVI
jgi:hypothetical protein